MDSTESENLDQPVKMESEENVTHLDPVIKQEPDEPAGQADAHQDSQASEASKADDTPAETAADVKAKQEQVAAVAAQQAPSSEVNNNKAESEPVLALAAEESGGGGAQTGMDWAEEEPWVPQATPEPSLSRKSCVLKHGTYIIRCAHSCFSREQRVQDHLTVPISYSTDSMSWFLL